MSDNDGLTAAEKQYFESSGETSVEEPSVESKEPEPKKPPEGFVPHGALHEERERRKALQQELSEIKSRVSGFDDLKSQVLELREKYSKQNETSFEEDPIKAMYDSQQEIRKRIEEQEQYLRLQEHNNEYARQQSDMINKYQRAAQDYTKSNPDFSNAYRYIIEARQNQYSALGYTPDEVIQIMQEEERQIVQRAFSDEANPAERIYNLAVASGYQSKPKSDLHVVKNGIENAQTLSNSQSTTEGNDTIQKLLELEGEEFEKAWAKLMG